jgi:transcriptional regulator with XRE-family HTH domain
MSGFGPRIAARRSRLGMTLRDVEEITDGAISNAYLSQLEHGKIKNPSAKIVLALAAAYHIDPTDMLDWLGEQPNIKPPAICPTCGRARIGETWMEKLGVAIDGSTAKTGSTEGESAVGEAETPSAASLTPERARSN